MTSSRVPPVPPDKGIPSDKASPTQHRKVEKVEKITKISEVDEETRARKFRQMVEQPEETPSEHPTPFDLFASGSSSRALGTEPEEAEGDQTGSVSGGAPVQEPATPPSSGMSVEEEEEGSPLPQSREIWRMMDEPPDMVPEGPSFQENQRSASRIFDKTAGKEEPSGQGKKAADKKEKGAFKESQPFGLPGKQPSRMAGRTAAPFGEKRKETKEKPIEAATKAPRQPAAARALKKGEETFPVEERKGAAEAAKAKRPEALEKDLASLQPAARSLKKEEKGKKTPPPSTAAEKKSVAKQPEEVSETRETELSRSPKEQREEWKEEKKSPKEEIASPSLTPLLPEAIPVAQTAASAAAPYLNPDTLAVYFHVIGTIVAMTAPSGDSRTEFVLNAPSFANSKFYGSTIVIEKFATAPYSLNIRLTGSTEAVDAFNKNIPNLFAAFRRGNFSFAVNRIEAVYEKPLVRRREAPRDKGFGKGK